MGIHKIAIITIQNKDVISPGHLGVSKDVIVVDVILMRESAAREEDHRNLNHSIDITIVWMTVDELLPEQITIHHLDNIAYPAVRTDASWKRVLVVDSIWILSSTTEDQSGVKIDVESVKEDWAVDVG